jgi:hypothetical protein
MNEVNVLAELERAGRVYQWAGEDEVKIVCPFHKDKDPSCCVSVSKRAFRCPVAGCGAEGDIIKLLAALYSTSRAAVWQELQTRYTFDVAKTVDPDVIERWHRAIWQAGPLLQALRDRCVTDDMLRRYRIGVHEGRVTIPIKNDSGLYVNVRRYLPGAPGDQKMRNLRGRGKIRLFPPDQMRFDDVFVTGGEIKAIVAAEELNRHGIGAVCATAGEGNWAPELTAKFLGKGRVWTGLDVDDTGRMAAHDLCRQLSRVAKWVGDVELPLDRARFPHGDVNDYVAQGFTLFPLLEQCPQFYASTGDAANTAEGAEPEEMELGDAVNAEATGRRLRVKAVVSSLDTAPYIVPSKARVECSKDQDFCALCPVYTSASEEWVVPAESIAVLEMIGTSLDRQRDSLMRCIGIPRDCRVCKIDPTDFYNVEDAKVSPQLEITNRSTDRFMQPAYCIGPRLELNETYQLTGRLHPHPKNQQATLLVSEYETTQDALSTYVPRDLEALELFQPQEWTVESLTQKLDELYEDLEANVTHVYRRRDIHLFVDLAYHSPLLIKFDGPKPTKGWVDVLILGDSGQGKSEVACGSQGDGGFRAFYGLGEKMECKNASVAGVLGGVQKFGDRFFVTWGILPTHDKRLVILEEVKGASTEVIAKLTDMRSSGVAEIQKIEKRRTKSRTRQVWLSNPRSQQPMASYNFGIEAVRELIGGLEDIRRFDAVLIVSAGDVDAKEINQLRASRPHVEHRHRDELCRSLILWSWTRTAEQVEFEEAAAAFIMEAATEMCDEFTDVIPIVDRGSMRMKLARLSASLAARTFSHLGSEREGILVRRCHAEYIVAMLRRIYVSNSFGYDGYTAAVRLTQTLGDSKTLKKTINETPFPRDFVKSALHTDRIDLQDVQDWCGWHREDCQKLISVFVRKHALMREGRQYRKTPPFIQLLKEMLNNGCLIDRPDHVEEPSGQEEY